MRVNTIQYRSTQGDFIVECCSRSIVRNCFMIVPSLSDRTSVCHNNNIIFSRVLLCNKVLQQRPLRPPVLDKELLCEKSPHDHRSIAHNESFRIKL